MDKYQDKVAITLTLDEWSWTCAALMKCNRSEISSQIMAQVEEYFKGPRD